MFMAFAKGVRRLFLAASAAARPVRRSYAQHGEDEWLSDRISSQELAAGVYIDVGANHPTLISNTYRFYRLGGRGFIIEPNRRFRSLYHHFRGRDVVLSVGCGAVPAVAKFFANRHAVLSGFVEDKQLSDGSFEYLPILPLDTLVEVLEDRPIYLLSIDVEGLNYEVLLGASTILSRTKWLVIEYGTQREKIEALLRSYSFVPVHENHCNMIFEKQA